MINWPEDYIDDTAPPSVVRMELLNFFHQNPYSIDSVNSLAIRVNRDSIQVQQALEKLEDLGIVEKRFSSGLPIYRLIKSNLPKDKTIKIFSGKE